VEPGHGYVPPVEVSENEHEKSESESDRLAANGVVSASVSGSALKEENVSAHGTAQKAGSGNGSVIVVAIAETAP
jgi:hypothetical protein